MNVPNKFWLLHIPSVSRAHKFLLNIELGLRLIEMKGLFFLGFAKAADKFPDFSRFFCNSR